MKQEQNTTFPSPIFYQSQKMAIKIIKVSSKKQLKAFIDFKHDLFEGDPNYVPELFIAQRDMLTKGKHPSHAHIDFELFLAYKGNKICGRIAGIYNKNHNQFTQREDGFFGFFDSINDYEVVEELFKAALGFLNSKKINTLVGPVDFSTNDPAGLLVEGFDSPPQIMMTYAKSYYKDLLEQFGFKKQTDLLAYWVSVDAIPERVIKLASNIEERLKRRGVTIRTVNMKNFKQEVVAIREIYNQAWGKNFGFVPMTNDEFDYLAKDMKLILDKDFLLVAEKNGQPIGFTLTVPNLNEVMIDVKRGRLLPTGIFKLLFNKSKIKSLRVITLGVLEEYRMLGIEVCFYVKLLEKAREKGYIGGEASWILEHNEMMNRGLKNINSKEYKKYRLYEKKVF